MKDVFVVKLKLLSGPCGLQISGCHLVSVENHGCEGCHVSWVDGGHLPRHSCPSVGLWRHQAPINCEPLSPPRVGGDEELLDGPGPRRAFYGHGPLGEGR